MRPQETFASKILETMKAFNPDQRFTSNDIANLSEIRKGRVQVYFNAMAKQGKIVLVDKSKYPYVYRWAGPDETPKKKMVIRKSKNQQACEAIEDSKRDYESELKYKIQDEPDNSFNNVSPLQIGLGIIGLIQSLKNGGDHDVKGLKLRIKELEGNIFFKEQDIRQIKMQLTEYKTLLERKDKQIDLLSRHLGVLTKGSGVSIKDILDKA